VKRLSDNAAFNDLKIPRMLSLLSEVNESFDIVKDESAVVFVPSSIR